MADTPVFTPAPKESSPFARYTGEQIPNIPGNFLESIGSAARIVSEKQALAKQLEQSDRQFAAKMMQEQQNQNQAARIAAADNELKSRQLDSDAFKNQIAAEDLKTTRAAAAAKAQLEQADFQLKYQKQTSEQLSSARSVLNSNIRTDEDVIDLDNKETDPSKKINPSEASIIKSRLLNNKAQLNEVSNRILEMSGINTGNFNPKNPGLSKETALKVETIRNNGDTDAANSSIALQAKAEAERKESERIAAERKTNWNLSSGDKNISVESDGSGIVTKVDGNDVSGQNIRISNLTASASEAGVGVVEGESLYPGELNRRIPIKDTLGIEGIAVKDPETGLAPTPTKIQGTLDYNPENKTFTAVFNKGLTDQNSIYERRRLEAISWVLNSNIDLKNVPLSKESYRAFSSAYGTKNNESQLEYMARASSVVDNIMTPGADTSFVSSADLVNTKFRDLFGFDVQEFIKAGSGASVNQPSASLAANVNEAYLKKQEEIEKATSELGVYERGQNPYAKTSLALTEKLQKLGKYKADASDDPKEVASIETQEKSIQRQIDANKVNYQAFEDAQNQKLADYNLKTKRIETLKHDQEEILKRIGASSAQSDELTKVDELIRKIPGATVSSLEANGGYYHSVLNKRSLEDVTVPEFVNGHATGKKITTKLTARQAIKLSIKQRSRNPILDSFAGQLPSEEDNKVVAESTKAYNAAKDPLTRLALKSQELAKKGTAPAVIAQLLDDELNTSEPDRMAIIAATRVATVGGGNPSNYEQEMMQNQVPDLTKLNSFSSRNALRYKKLILLAITARHISMKRSGMVMDDSALDQINRQYSGALGRKLTREDIEGAANIYETGASTYDRMVRANATAEEKRNLVNANQEALFDIIEGKKSNANGM